MGDILTNLRHQGAARVLPVLPESVQAKIGNPSATWKPRDLRQVASAPQTRTRLLIAPANYAGQGYRWARAAETLPGVGAHCLQTYDPARWSRFPADTHVRTNVWGYSTIWKARQRRELEKFTHVLVEAGRPILQDGGWSLVTRDIDLLRDMGLKVGLIWHGTDVRLPSRHLELEPFSPYRDADPNWVKSLEAQAQANHDLADALGLPEFVSNPYLLSFRPQATWLPTLSDPERWNADLPADDGHLPVVLHVPSQRVWKGTDIVRPILQRLEKEGLIRYIDVTVVPPDEMPALVASADIVVDGILNGQYGVASLEAMLSRRVAVAHTWKQTRGAIQEGFGVEVPVVEADPDSFEDVIRGLAADPEQRRSIGSAGRDFTLKVHSEQLVASALEPFLTS